MYISRVLSGTLHQMMIATLNNMPDEPTKFMQDYINLHYFDDPEKLQTEISPRTKAVMEERQRVGKADVQRLKQEIAELKAQKEQLATYKTSFWTMHKQLWDIS